MKRSALISVLVGAALAIVPLASAQVMSVDSDGGGVSGLSARAAGVEPFSSLDPAIQAALLHNGSAQRIYGKSVATADRSRTVTMAPTSYQDAIREYGTTNGTAFNGTTDTLSGNTGATPSSSGSSADTNWNAIAPAILTALLLVGMAVTITRRRHQHQPSF